MLLRGRGPRQPPPQPPTLAFAGPVPAPHPGSEGAGPERTTPSSPPGQLEECELVFQATRHGGFLAQLIPNEVKPMATVSAHGTPLIKGWKLPSWWGESQGALQEGSNAPVLRGPGWVFLGCHTCLSNTSPVTFLIVYKVPRSLPASGGNPSTSLLLSVPPPPPNPQLPQHSPRFWHLASWI